MLGTIYKDSMKFIAMDINDLSNYLSYIRYDTKCEPKFNFAGVLAITLNRFAIDEKKECHVSFKYVFNNILLYLFIANHGSIAAANVQEDCDYPGSTFSVKPLKTPKDCLSLCNNTDNCLGFVFVSGWNRCQLKSKIFRKVPLTITAGIPDEKQTYEIFPMMDARGPDLRSELVNDVKACQKTCQQEIKCKGFVFLDGYRTCWLKKALKSKKPYAKRFYCGAK